MSKNHRAAFAADPRFQARIAKALSAPAVPTDTVNLKAEDAAPSSPRKPSRAVQRMKSVQNNNKDGRFDSVSYCAESGAITLVLPGAMLLALNLMLRMHDAQSSGLKETWFQRIRALALENREVIGRWQSSVQFPLIVEEVYITGESSLLDTEAVAAACKPIIDALVRNAFIPDDSSKFVCQPIAYTERGPRPALVLSFRPSPKPWGHIEDATVGFARDAVGAKEL